jgi:hypothetical protein
LVLSLFHAVVVPSGFSTTVQPCWWMTIWWWKKHYADLRVMPMPGFPALVAGVRVPSGSA